MNILVTGGCGFIGSHLVDRLVSEKHVVQVIDNLSSDAHDQFYFNPNVTYYTYDIVNADLIDKVFERHKPEIVFHMAAQARIQQCIREPIKTININTLGTHNVLEAAKRAQTRRVIFSSTSAIYGMSSKSKQSEEDNPDCLNIYAYSKWFSEAICRLYSASYGIDTACLRYFNVYGPRQPKRGSYAPVIGIFSRQMSQSEPMTIVGDGLQTRDYVHVLDVISANIATMNKSTPLNGSIFNVGSGVAYSVIDIANMMGGEYVHVEPRDGESRHTCAMIDKISKELNWYPVKKLEEYLLSKEYVV